MIADVDGGPCLLCAACGAYCTVKPRNLRFPCPGREARHPAGLAALKQFRAGYAPNCDEYKGRRVHGVQPLHRAALDHWGQLPLVRHTEFTAKYFVNAYIARCSSQHSWAHLGDRWHCRRCAAAAFSPEALRRRER